MLSERKDKEQIHLYFREAETGRIVTHFLFPIKKWKYFEMLATLHNRSVDEEFKEAITQYANKVLSK